MFRRPMMAIFGLLLFAMPGILRAQFNFKSRPIEFHGFAAQGFALSDNNNYLTMQSSTGSAAFTDGGLNVASQVTSQLRVGAQVYVRRIGTLGKGRPTVDWALADYKFNDWLGIRAGKVKTVFGLYNDTQDMESLHTWALLPQSVYSLDLRSSTIAHTGADLYGEIPLPRALGSIGYTAFTGRRPDDHHGGYRDVTRQNGALLDTISGWTAGGDLRWNNLSSGLTMGVSWFYQPVKAKGTLVAMSSPYGLDVKTKSSAAYVDYLRGNLHLTAEYTDVDMSADVSGIPDYSKFRGDSRGWYAALAYRVHSKLELGTYHSRFISDSRSPAEDPTNHIYDQAVTARFDVNRHWNFKIEGHFMDGNGSVNSARGFYLLQNPNGFDRKTNLIVLRTGYTF